MYSYGRHKCKPLAHGIISLPDATSYDKKESIIRAPVLLNLSARCWKEIQFCSIITINSFNKINKTFISTNVRFFMYQKCLYMFYKQLYLFRYRLWRVLTGQHKSVEFSSMEVGHTKFHPDWHFGLWKVNTLNYITVKFRESVRYVSFIHFVFQSLTLFIVYVYQKHFHNKYP